MVRGLLIAGIALAGLALLFALPSAAAQSSPTCTVEQSGPNSGGWYTGPVRTWLNVTPPDATVTYQLNGAAFTPYTAPFTTIFDDSENSLLCRATNAQGDGFKGHDFKVDRTPPSGCAHVRARDHTNSNVLSGTDNWYAPASAASGLYDDLNPTDAMSGISYINVQIDGASTTVQPGYIVRIQNEGIHTVSCIVTDKAGHVATFTHQIGLDTTAPFCSIQNDGIINSNGWRNTLNNWTFVTSDTGSGIHTTGHRVDNAVETTYAGPFQLEDGSGTLYCRVTDKAGNFFETSTYFQQDTTAPDPCSIQRFVDQTNGYGLSPSNGWYRPARATTSGFSIYLTSSDATSAINAFTVRIDGGQRINTAVGSGMLLFVEGTHTLECQLTDNAGNVRINHIPLNIDGAPPTCTVAHTGQRGERGWYRDGVVRVTIQDANSGIAGVNLTIDGTRTAYAPPTPLAGIMTLDLDREGAFSLTCAANDGAGNVLATTHAAKLDRTAPTCNFAFTGRMGREGWHVGGGVITLEAIDNASGVTGMSHKIDSGTFRGYTKPFSLDSDGEHVVTCNAVDDAGNVGTTTFPLRIDTTPPSLCTRTARDASGKIVASKGDWYGLAVDVELVTLDKMSGLDDATILFDNKPVEGITRTGTDARVTLRVDQRGTHTLTCSATDKAGNTVGPIGLAVNVDDVAPACRLLPERAPGANGWYPTRVNIGLEGQDAESGVASISAALDGGATSAYREPLSVEGDGNHRLACTIVDAAGNRQTQSFDVRIDGTPPVCDARIDGAPVDEHAVYTLADLERVVTLETTDATSGLATRIFKLNGAIVEASLPLTQAGIHEIECSVTDQAGLETNRIFRIRLDDGSGRVPAAAVEPPIERQETPLPLLVLLVPFIAILRRRRER